MPTNFFINYCCFLRREKFEVQKVISFCKPDKLIFDLCNKDRQTCYQCENFLNIGLLLKCVHPRFSTTWGCYNYGYVDRNLAFETRLENLCVQSQRSPVMINYTINNEFFL